MSFSPPDRPMRVLHVTPAFAPSVAYGGAVTVIYDLCSSLASAGVTVNVLTTNGNGDDKVLDVDCDREVPLAPGLRARYCRRICRQAVSPEFMRYLPSAVRWADVVHLHGVYSFPTLPTLAVCRLFGKPVLWTPHGVLQRWAGSRRKMAKAGWELVCRALLPRAAVLHASSEQEAQDNRVRFPGSDIVTIPFGHHVPDQSRRIEDGTMLRLLFLGRLDPKKGLENLIEACRIRKSRPTGAWSLVIAGDGEARYATSLRALIESKGLSERVTVVGDVQGERKDELFSRSDVLVVPSHTENFARVVVEALGHGIPVIASRGTPWQRIEDVGCGLWVDNSPDSLAAAIERISRLPLRQMGQLGRTWLLREFQWEKVAQAFIVNYERTMSDWRSARLPLASVSHLP